MWSKPFILVLTSAALPLATDRTFLCKHGPFIYSSKDGQFGGNASHCTEWMLLCYPWDEPMASLYICILWKFPKWFTRYVVYNMKNIIINFRISLPSIFIYFFCCTPFVLLFTSLPFFLDFVFPYLFVFPAISSKNCCVIEIAAKVNIYFPS